MKTKKLFLSISLVLLAAFAFIGCQSTSVFDDILSAADSINEVADSYLYDDQGALSTMQEMSLKDGEYIVSLLDDSPSNLQIYNELRLQLIALHQAIMAEKDSLVAERESIRTSVMFLRENNYKLLADDYTYVQEQIQNLKTYRENLMSTQGQAYARIYELRGSYTIANIENIITVFQEVKAVLEYRLQIMQNAGLCLEGIDELLVQYTES